PRHLVLGGEGGELAREHLAVGLVAAERVGVVGLGVVPSTGHGAADLQCAAGGEGEGVLLRQARRLRLAVARGFRRPPAPARGGSGGRDGRGGHRGGHCCGGEDLAASHGVSFDVIGWAPMDERPGLVRASRGRGGHGAPEAQPLTEPSMTPETKYRCTNGYTHRMGIRIRIIVTDWMLALMSLTAEPEAAAPSDAAVEAPAIRFLRNSVTGNRSVRSR